MAVWPQAETSLLYRLLICLELGRGTVLGVSENLRALREANGSLADGARRRPFPRRTPTLMWIPALISLFFYVLSETLLLLLIWVENLLPRFVRSGCLAAPSKHSTSISTVGSG